MKKVLLMSNNNALFDKLPLYLSAEKIIVEQCTNANEHMSHIIKGSYSLFMLSTKFCDEWVSEILNIRKLSNIPIIVLDDNRNIYDEITAYRIGADDYIGLPYEPLELSIHIQALVRRYTQYSSEAKKPDKLMQFQGLSIDMVHHSVYRNGEELSLTKTEFNLLSFLAEHNGQTLTKEQIYSNVWNGEYLYDDKNIITHIRRLRHKIEENPENPLYIHTIRGIGYQFKQKSISK